jgi:hypothetical protein
MPALQELPLAADAATGGDEPATRMDSPALGRLVERVIRNADFARRGRRMVDDGLLELGPFAAVPAGDFSDWQADPLRNRSWQWRLNWLSFIAYLVAHHAATGDASAIRLAFRAARSWLQHFGPPEAGHGFEFAWHDHGTAMRAEQLALLIRYADTRGLWKLDDHADTATLLVDACVGHASRLADDGFYSRHTNHGLIQCRVLLLIASSLRGVTAPLAEWRDKALERIAGELRHAFTSEGVHVENSPAYHALVLKLFLGMMNDYPAASLGPVRQWMAEVGPKALDFLTRVLRPDGLLPIIGDTEALPVADTFKPAFDGQPAYEEFVYARRAGRKGRAPEALHRVWPESGYAVFRSSWAGGDAYGRALHLVFKAGATSPYHRQQDDGSIVVCRDGEDWLIDSGMFNYDKTSPIRLYMRSRQAHNTTVLNRPLADPRSRTPKDSWHVLAHSEADAAPFVEASSRAYAGADIVRRVSLRGGRAFQVDDTIVATDGSPVDASFLWHVPADKRVEILGAAEVLVHSGTSRQAMRIRVHGDLLDQVECRSGTTKAQVWSVVSRLANTQEASQVLVFTANRRSRIGVRFEFVFEEP